MKLSELAERLDCRLEGDGSLQIERVAGIERAESGDLTFFANSRYLQALRTTRASAVILGDEAPAAPCAMLRSSLPYVAFADALALFHPVRRPPPGIHPRASVDDEAHCGADVSIGALAVVERGVVIGDRTVVHAHAVVGEEAVVGADCEVHAHAVIRERVRIGNRVVVHNGAVIGSDGFGFARRADGSHTKIPQVGGVVVEDDVEIGANTTIDRPSVGETRIASGTKIDNLVQIAHGVQLGRHVVLAAQVGIAGSTVIEDSVTLAGQVGVAGHVCIGKGTIATAQTGIPNSLDPGSFVSGYPAVDNREWLKASAVFKRLPLLKKAVAALETRIAAIERLSSSLRSSKSS